MAALSREIASLERQLENIKVSIAVERESEEPKEEVDIYEHPTYKYYQKEMDAAEKKYNEVMAYYEECIENLKKKLNGTQESLKIQKLLKNQKRLETLLEQKNAQKATKDAIELALLAGKNKIKADQAAEENRKKAKEEARKEEEKKRAALAALEQEKRKDRERQEAVYEAEKKAAPKKFVIKKNTPSPPGGGVKNSTNLLTQIRLCNSEEEFEQLSRLYWMNSKYKCSQEEEEAFEEASERIEKLNAPEIEAPSNDIEQQEEPSQWNFQAMPLDILKSMDVSEFSNNDVRLYMAEMQRRGL